MRNPLLHVAFLIGFAAVPLLRAQNYWNVASGDWATSGNWSPASAAGGPSGVIAHVRNNGTATLTGAANSATGIAAGRDGTGTVHLNSGSVSANNLQSGWSYGTHSSGTVNVNGGTMTITSGWNQIGVARNDDSGYNSTGGLGGNANALGVINVAGGTLNLSSGSSRYYQGYVRTATNGSGTGTLNVSAGTMTVANAAMIGGDESSGSGEAHGWVNMSGGVASFNNWVTSGFGPSGRATWNVSGGTLNLNNEVSLGEGGGQASLTLNGAAAAVNVGSTGLHIGRGANSVGTLNLQAGTLTVAGSTQVGGYTAGNGAGSVHQSGGVFQSNGTWLELAQQSTSTGHYVMTGGVLNHNGIGGGLVVGSRGAGTFQLSGTGRVTAGDLLVGSGFDGQTFTARWDQTGGTTTVNTLRIGDNNNAQPNNATGLVHLEGGTLRVNTIHPLGNGGSQFNWGEAVLTTRQPASGAAGVTDYTLAPTPSGPVVRSGQTLAANLPLTTGFNGGQSTLDLGGLYLNNGVRTDVLAVSGTLNLGGADRLAWDDSTMYFLRPFGFFTEDYGSIPLVTASAISGTFDTFIGLSNDGRGWSAFTGVFSGASSLDLNTWYLETTGTQVLFHYRVAGFVPEPGTFGLMAMGALLLRARRRFNSGRAGGGGIPRAGSRPRA
jgi:hypothetical protein